MLESFFFIPPNINNFAVKVQNIDADNVVIDFEESVKQKQFEEFVEYISSTILNETVFVRPTLRRDDGTFFIDQYESLLKHGFQKFLLPKIENIENIKHIYKVDPESAKNNTFILSIENPKAFIKINELINNRLLNFWGMVFGSHDFCSYSGMMHTLDNLATARFLISTYASAFKLYSIDIASVNTIDEDAFRLELQTAMEMGYNAKAILHPIQLTWLKKFNNDLLIANIIEANEVIDFYKESGEPLIFKFKGKIYERPHIKRLLEFLEQHIK